MIKLALIGAFVLSMLLSPVRVVGQADLDVGQVADPATTDSVAAFVTSYFELFNARNVAAVDLVSPNVWTLFYSGTYEGAVNYLLATASPVEVYDIDDVRIHDTGHVSALVTFSGWDTPYTLYTRRWHLLPLAGGGYVIDGGEYIDAPEVPEAFTTAELDVVVDRAGVSLSEDELPSAEVLVYNVSNADTRRVLTTGVYILPEGISVSQAQAEFAAGNFGFLEYVGPTPVWPGVPWTFAFLVEPGTTYLVQEFALDDAGQNPAPFLGSEYAATFTVAD